MANKLFHYGVILILLFSVLCISQAEDLDKSDIDPITTPPPPITTTSPPPITTRSPPTTSPPTTPPPTTPPPDTCIIGWEGNIPIIDWRCADQYYDQYVIVEGTIVDTYNSGKACFLNFHPKWKVYFTAVIFANRFHKFPANPEIYYKGKKVRVRGVVEEYQGAPQIILEDIDQIEIIG